jgi:molybdenum cofactor cytidylyltransferase
MDNIGIIILAAGSSSRMGQPKQLLKYKDTSLLRHAVETAQASRCKGPVLIVTGALHDELFKECIDLNVSVAHNTNWQQGMATSIHTGLRALTRDNAETTGALIMLCDQPLITTEHLNNLLDMFLHHQQKVIVATAFANVVGSPCIFSREVFEELYKLKGDKGARQIFEDPPQRLVTVPFKPAAVDVDTMEDYENLF